MRSRYFMGCRWDNGIGRRQYCDWNHSNPTAECQVAGLSQPGVIGCERFGLPGHDVGDVGSLHGRCHD